MEEDLGARQGTRGRDSDRGWKRHPRAPGLPPSPRQISQKGVTDGETARASLSSWTWL